MCYLDDIIKSSAAAAHFSTHDLIRLLVARAKFRAEATFLAVHQKKHKYLVKIKEEKFCAFTIVFWDNFCIHLSMV